jgi:hypothetical protein
MDISIPIKIFRRGDLLVKSEIDYLDLILKLESKNYFAVAFEFHHDSSLLKKLGAMFILNFGIRKW